VPFTPNDEFVILLVEFQTQFQRTKLREILVAVRKAIRTRAQYQNRPLDNILFVCAVNNYQGVRFARFTSREGQQPKLSVFGWDRSTSQGVHTLLEYNLRALTMNQHPAEGCSVWQETNWQSAWNVETAEKRFFLEYERAFRELESLLHADIEDRRLFTQRLLNRLMFVHFLSKKGWLSFNSSTDYLHELWNGRVHNGEFYHTHLYPQHAFGAPRPPRFSCANRQGALPEWRTL
jgi:hypothetical protein